MKVIRESLIFLGEKKKLGNRKRLEAENVILRKFQLLIPKKICMSSNHKRELENMHAHKNHYQCHTQTIRFGTSTTQNRHIIENS